MTEKLLEFLNQSAWAVLLGVLSSFVVVIFVEWKRKPRLILSIAPPSDQTYSGPPNSPATIMRCIRVRVRNEELPKLLRWMRREPALNCLGTIRFMYLDGARVFTEDMPARWTGSPEAVPLRGMVGINPLIIWDPSRLSIVSRMDITAGEQEDLDAVIRCDDDVEAYGFNNESYQFDWRNPRWRLEKGRYLIEATIRSSGEKVSALYQLNNDISRDQFRLDPD